MSKEKKRRVQNDKNKDGLVYFEIWGILLILFSVVLLSELGPVGRTFNILIKVVFGDWYWLILVFLFYYGVLMIVYHEFITFTSIKIKGIIFASAGLLLYSHFPIYVALKDTIAANDSNIVSETYNLYMDYIKNKYYSGTFGGGIIGAILFWAGSLLLGEIGTRIIAIILLISGVAYLFEKTVYDFIDDAYFGTINFYKNSKKSVKKVLDKMIEASNSIKKPNEELVMEKVPTNEHINKFENIVMTKNEHIEVKKTKYSKPNIRSLKYHENKQVLENQKEITIQNAKIINEFLKSFHMNLEVSEIYIGPTISTYIMQVENSYKSKKIMNHKIDLVTRLNIDHVRIYEKYEKSQCLYIEVPNKFRYLVSLREILEEDIDYNVIPIGRNHSGKIYYIDFKSMSNILVMGNDINSKIDLLKTVINVIYYKFSPEEFQLILCDSTKFEINTFEGLPHLFYEFITDFHTMKPMLIKLYQELENRLTKLNEGLSKFTPILLVLNDFVDFYHNNNDYLRYLNSVLVYGAKVNIFVIYSTNIMDERILTNNLRAQFDVVISFMMNNKEISFKYLEEDATQLLKEGDCLIFSRNDNTNTRVQIVNITTDDIFYR